MRRVRIPDQLPLEWGRTKRLLLERIDGEWFCSEWYDVVDAPEGGLHHGSRGSLPADTVLVALADEVIALADVFNIEPTNVYCWDNEYYLVLRVREVLEPELWSTLPWRDFGPGNVVHVWDKFHGIDYLRGQLDRSRVMSYGGDFADLEELVNRARPPARSPARAERPSPTSLLAAVQENDLERVERLLAQGIPAGDQGVPDGVRALELGFSVARGSSPLSTSIASASASVTEALLKGGAPPDERSEAGFTPLHFAIIQRRVEHVRVLLRFGADPRLEHEGKSAIRLAEAIDPELAAIVRGESA